MGPTGKVVVFEPDAESAAALRVFAARTGMTERLLVVEKAAWHNEDTLTFLVNPSHPASNLVDGTGDVDPRHYIERKVEAGTIDGELAAAQLGVPRLLSITANGSEKHILEGAAKSIHSGITYVSLAVTGDGYPALMEACGYGLAALDDRGFTFRLAG